MKLTEQDKQQMRARSSADFEYGKIWTSVGKCVFCDLNEKYILDSKNDIVLTTNLYPYIDGSLMIVPKRHIDHLKQLTKEEWEAVQYFHYIAKKFLRLTFGYKTLFMLYREGAALDQTSQKTVHHLHIHLLPYIPTLLQFNYQKIKYPPRLIAKLYKENADEIEKIKTRYKQKYG